MTDPRAEKLLTEDREARLAAQREFVKPLVLEAGAGTGKTTTLVARVLAWTLGAGWEESVAECAKQRLGEERVAVSVLEGVVAITFTEAAAAEMESRIARALAEVAAGDASSIVGFTPPPEVSPHDLPARAQALLAALDHLAVRTIHAFCLNLLKRYPLEARLHPDLTVDADGTFLEELVSEIVEHELRSAYTHAGDSPLIYLARRGIGPRRIAAALRQLAERGFAAEHLGEEPFDDRAVDLLVTRLRRPLEGFRELALEKLATLPANQNGSKIAVAVTASLKALESIDAERLEPLATATALVSMVGEHWPLNLAKSHLGKWRRGDLSKREAAELGSRAGELASIARDLRSALRQIRKLDPALLDQARLALQGLLEKIDSEMRARGTITFSGLLQETQRLLAEHRGVRARESGRIRQLLVDEFQDTDRLQCDLVRLLSLTGPPERRPGLFVVGDPKQSIYGWRNADLEAYEGFLAAATESGGRRYSLVENFRSAAPILAEVDRSVNPIMLAEAGLQPAYEPLVACQRLADSPGFERADRAAIEHWVSWHRPGHSESSSAGGPDTHNDDAARLEAAAIARDVRELVDAEESSWSDFAVLLRSGTRLDTFLSAFRDAGVPFAVARDKSYFLRREIIEAAALIRAVVNPVDHLALVTFLRSSSVGVPDAAILPLWRHRFPDLLSEFEKPTREQLAELRQIVRSAAAEVPSDIPGIAGLKGWDKSLLYGVETLVRLRESFVVDAPDRFIENVRTWLLLEATESARYLGSFRVANLERFLRQLESALERKGGDIQSVLRNLRRGVAEAREAEEAVPKEAALDAVQILTIHAAKGLEFRHVYLPQLHARSRDSDNDLVDTDERWSPGSPLEYRLFGTPTPGFDRVRERRREVEQAERTRLLYVAMTRAGERLVMIGKWRDRPAPVDDDRRQSFLDLLGSRNPLPRSIEELAEDTIDQGRGHPTADSLWVFPGYREEPDRAWSSRQAPDWLPTPATVTESADYLERLEEVSSQRMARPFHRAATYEAGERLGALARESGERGGSLQVGRSAAMTLGTAIHRLFETWDFATDPTREFERQREAVRNHLRSNVAENALEEVLERSEELLKRIQSGKLLERFLALGPRVVAREVPVTLPPEPEGSGAVGYLAGAIDLVCRAEDGGWLIVDFKTDAIELDLEIETRARTYSSQETLYAEALQSALALDETPRCELWFLWPDRLVTV